MARPIDSSVDDEYDWTLEENDGDENQRRVSTDGVFKDLVEGILQPRALYGSEVWIQMTSSTGENRPSSEGDIQISRADLRSVDSVDDLLTVLNHSRANPNSFERGNTVVHTYVTQDRADLLLALLLNADDCLKGKKLDIDVKDESEGNTPIHIAAKLGKEWLVKLLVAFGAKIDILNKDRFLPVDLVCNSTDTVLTTLFTGLAPRPLKMSCHQQSEAQGRHSRNRMLFLDGGGVRGLVEIEILMEIERRTERKIVELFDWIIGTSTGAIIALGLVYGQLPLKTIKHALLKARNSVFGALKFPKNRSSNMEEMLKNLFGKETHMSSKKPPNVPKVMVLALSKKTDHPEPHFFNNCFDNPPFSTELVWKVGRYVSAAAPFFFTEMDNYVDGGYQANNPSQMAWSEIHRHLPQEERFEPSLIVSVGTGLPTEKTITIGNLTGNASFLYNLIGNAKLIADNFKVERERGGTPYYRFNPPDIDVGSLENDIHKLVDMIIHTKLYLNEEKQLDDMQQMINSLTHA